MTSEDTQINPASESQTEQEPIQIWHLYKITNQVNGKIYIGQTKQSIIERFKEHCRPSSRCQYLRRAIEKHGSESFVIEEIASAKSLADVLAGEVELIAQHDSTNPDVGYNLSLGGEGVVLPQERAAERNASIRASWQRLIAEETPEQREERRAKHSACIAEGWARRMAEAPHEVLAKTSALLSELQANHWQRFKTETPEAYEAWVISQSEATKRGEERRKASMSPDAYAKLLEEEQARRTAGIRAAKALRKATITPEEQEQERAAKSQAVREGIARKKQEQTPEEREQEHIRRSNARPTKARLSETDLDNIRSAFAAGSQKQTLKDTYHIGSKRLNLILIGEE